MAKIFFSDLKTGHPVETFGLVRKSELRDASTSRYLLMELGDRSGRIKAVLWKDPEAVARSLRAGDVVKVIGMVTSYKDNLQIKIDAIRAAQESEYAPEDIMTGPRTDVGQLKLQLRGLMDRVANPHLRGLLDFFLGESAQTWAAFCEAPAGKLWHHSYRGGLLEHSVSVSEICLFLSGRFEFLDADLLVCGALLHDIGKVVEYDYRTAAIDFSDEGRLKGHLVIGYEMINAAIRNIQGFPSALATRLGHMILAHQGQKDFGSPVVPQTLEALLVYYSDEIDSKANAFGRILSETRRAGKSWSEFVPLMERYLFAGIENDGQP